MCSIRHILILKMKKNVQGKCTASLESVIWYLLVTYLTTMLKVQILQRFHTLSHKSFNPLDVNVLLHCQRNGAVAAVGPYELFDCSLYLAECALTMIELTWVLSCLRASDSCGWRCYVFRLPIHLYIPFSWRWYLRKALREALQIWHKCLQCPHKGSDELFRIWWLNVKLHKICFLATTQ